MVAINTAPRATISTLASIAETDPIGNGNWHRVGGAHEQVDRPVGQSYARDRPVAATRKLSVIICLTSRHTGRAESAANRELARTQSRAPELHVHDVHTRNQKNDNHRP